MPCAVLWLLGGASGAMSKGSRRPHHHVCAGARSHRDRCIRQVKIGMDVAASEFQTEDKMYDLKFKEKDNDGSGKKTG